MKYRKKRLWKYEVIETVSFQVDILDIEYNNGYIDLHKDGLLVIKKNYRWDGPSGPTIDTPAFMVGSLVHDALYQLIRQGTLNIKNHKEIADKLLKTLCIEHGMSKFRAWYVYKSVKRFGFSSCRSDILIV